VPTEPPELWDIRVTVEGEMGYVTSEGILAVIISSCEDSASAIMDAAAPHYERRATPSGVASARRPSSPRRQVPQPPSGRSGTSSARRWRPRTSPGSASATRPRSAAGGDRSSPCQAHRINPSRESQPDSWDRHLQVGCNHNTRDHDDEQPLCLPIGAVC
jgi:hypothetical protein